MIPLFLPSDEIDAYTAKIKTLEADLQQMRAKQGADTGTQEEVAADSAQLKQQCQAHQETITRMKTETEQDRDEQRRLKGIIDEQRGGYDKTTVAATKTAKAIAMTMMMMTMMLMTVMRMMIMLLLDFLQ